MAHFHAKLLRMPTAQQFICKKCTALSNVQTFEQTRDGVYYCRCDKCGAELTQRADDSPEVVRRRFENYQAETVPVIEFFKREHPKQCVELSADASSDEVLQQARQQL